MCEVADAEPSSLAAWAGSSVMRNQAQDAKKQLFQGLAFKRIHRTISQRGHGLRFLTMYLFITPMGPHSALEAAFYAWFSA